MRNIKDQLKQFRMIRPDAAYVSRTRAAILAERPTVPVKTYFSFSRVATAGAFVFAAALLFLFASLDAPTLTAKPSLSSLEDTQALQQEFDAMNITIQLNDISFQTDADKTITAAITEITDTKTQHMNPDTLRSESNPTVPDTGKNPQIDQLLNKIIL